MTSRLALSGKHHHRWRAKSDNPGMCSSSYMGADHYGVSINCSWRKIQTDFLRREIRVGALNRFLWTASVLNVHYPCGLSFAWHPISHRCHRVPTWMGAGILRQGLALLYPSYCQASDRSLRSSNRRYLCMTVPCGGRGEAYRRFEITLAATSAPTSSHPGQKIEETKLQYSATVIVGLSP